MKYFCIFAILTVNILFPLVTNGETNLTNLQRIFENNFQYRIVGGEVTNVSKYPFLVSLQFGHSHGCGGSLYKNDIVLTAAHCCYDLGTYKMSGLYVKIRVGRVSALLGTSISALDLLPDDAETRGVVHIVPHPQFSYITMENDICLVKLSFPVGLVQNIQLLPLKLSDPAPAPGTKCTAIGWGRTRPEKAGEDTHEPPSTLLQNVILDVVDPEQCSLYYKRASTGIICTYTGGKDACQGDSGGPLICPDNVAGLTSFGDGCAAKGIPGVFQGVNQHADWLATAERQCGSDTTMARLRWDVWFLCNLFSLRFLLFFEI